MDRKENDVVTENGIARGSFRAEPGREIRRLADGSPASLVSEIAHIGRMDRLLKRHAQSPSVMGHTMEADSEQNEREEYAENVGYRNG